MVMVMCRRSLAILVRRVPVLDDGLHELVIVDNPALDTQSLSIFLDALIAISDLSWGRHMLLGLCASSQSFIHFWKTPLIICGPPSVVMCFGMFHVAQKSIITVTRC